MFTMYLCTGLLEQYICLFFSDNLVSSITLVKEGTTRLRFPYGGVQQSGYAGTIMTPDPVNYNAEATDDFENEPPLMEGTTITKL